MSLMLSQRIAKSTGFLNSLIYSADELFELRLRIVQAPKVAVGHHLFDFHDTKASMMDKIGWKETDSIGKLEKLLARRNLAWRQFAKSPWPTFFLENDTGGMFVEERDGMVSMLPVGPTGQINGFRYVAHYQGTELRMDVVPHGLLATAQLEGEQLRSLQHIAAIRITALLDILLFLNTKNVTTHQYTPSRRENEAVPKPLQKFYVYRMVDVFRDHKKLQSLQQLRESFASPDAMERRAHIVRGHFKDTRFGLLWWSMHLRCPDSEGFADKDYRLQAA